MAEDEKPKIETLRLSGLLNSSVSASTATTIITGLGSIHPPTSFSFQDPTLLQKIKAVKAPDDHKIYSLVGRVASDWAHVEHLFDEMIWRLVGTDDIRGACVTAQMTGVYPRCKAIVALLTILGRRRNFDVEHLVKKTNELMQKSSGPGDKRNRIVHDPWYIYTEIDTTAQFKAVPQKDYRYGVHPVDETELKTTLEEIKNYGERVTKLRDDIFSAFPASR